MDNERAVAVRIGHSLIPSPVVADSVEVYLADEENPVLGEVIDEQDGVLFTPVVPFTGGLQYELRYGSRRVSIFEIPLDTTLSDPELLSVYPTADTVPENLLKMYFTFSEPMMEGSSVKHIYLLRDGRDTLRDTFLDLQPELWNAGSTVLTLWLDPGRVKRDLIPNKTLGQPIERYVRYTLVVSKGWRSRQGAHTQGDFSKSFYATGRDEAIPNAGRWTLDVPASMTTDSLFINFDEPMDFKLMTDAIHVLDGERRLVEGLSIPGPHEMSLCFIPFEPWKKGSYALMVEPRLEDLAGNNLSRPFDRDILSEPDESAAVEAREILFSIP